jgi:chromosomal replication initiation ATPase DnaA
VLLLARDPPARWPLALPDLRSRLLALPTVAVGAPDDALLAAVLLKLLADRQAVVGGDVLSYLTARMERSFAAAGRLAEALDQAALAEKRPITPALARQVLERLQDREP